MSLCGRQSIFALCFILNGIALTSCFIAYCIEWTNTDSQCGESQDVITSICVLASFVYGFGTLTATVFYIWFATRQYAHFSKMMTILLTLSSGGLIFSIVAGTGMLISLYFGFDPSCLVNDKSKAEFVCLWLLAFYAVISKAICLFLSTYAVFKSDQRKISRSSEVYIIPHGSIIGEPYKV